MVENILINKLFLDLIPVSNSAVGEEEVSRHFTKTVSDIFGIEKATLDNIYKEEKQEGNLHGYVANTRKPYSDNQLSEYSSFPELIGFWHDGFRSCALVPIIANGRVISILELLSKQENKFSDEMLSVISFGASLIGPSLIYKYETSKNVRIANYFNGAFNSNMPQFLVSNADSIVKFNKSAGKEFGIEGASKKNIPQILGIGFAELKQLSNGRSAKTILGSGNGKRVYSISSSPINDNLIHVSARDITKNELFDSVIETVNSDLYSGIVYLDGELKITGSNGGLSKMTGIENNMLVGKGFYELVIDSMRQGFKELAKRLENGHVIDSTDMIGSDSAPVRVRFVLSKWLNGYILVFTNAEAEREIKAIKGSFLDFINGASDIVITLDAIGFIKACNMPIEELLGYARDELIGKDVKSLYVDPSIIDRDITYVRNGMNVDNTYVTLIAKDSTKIPATQSTRIIKDDEGNTNYLIVLREKATKQKLKDKEKELGFLEKRLKNLSSIGEQKSQFIYNISHELKTPLTNIKGYSKLLYQGDFGDINDEQKSTLITIQEEADRLMQIIQQVLDAAKLETGKTKLDLKEVDLKELENNSTIRSLKEKAQSQGLSFAWNVAFDVPTIMADQSRLIQVFVNLIGNAIKFTNKGGIAVKITRKGRNFVECDVTDTGIGISDEDSHKLFKDFYEAPKKGLVKQAESGTGLGLSITKEIVRLHNGVESRKRSIGVESELGKGSKFWFVLPIKQKGKRKDQ
ncbi:MAG: PAS domain-containing protein [Candidatus Micrarchaeota archaeon]|nr:PAS domain-containing protein [Candidatus Micrarchaeota archaeon]